MRGGCRAEAGGLVLSGRRQEPAARLSGVRSLEGFQERHCVWSGLVRMGSSDAPGCHGENRLRACPWCVPMLPQARPARLGTPGAAVVPAGRWSRSSVLSVWDFAECRVCVFLGEGCLRLQEAERLTAGCRPCGSGLCSALCSPRVDLGPAGQSAIVAASLLPRGSAMTFQTNNQGVCRDLLLSQGQPRSLVFHP